MCVNFIHEWQNLHLKVDIEQQIWEAIYGKYYLHSEFLPENYWEEVTAS